jgi:tetratricopeptide (TPR) repeat protein
MPPRLFLESLISVARQKNADDSLLGEVLSVIYTIKDENYKYRCLELILDIFANSNPEVIIAPTQRLAKQLILEGNAIQALKVISKALTSITVEKLDSSSKARLYTEIGNAHRATFDYNEALSTYEGITSLIGNDLKNPNIRVNQLNIARVLRDMGRLGDAKMIFSEVLEHCQGRRERFDCLFGLGLTYHQNGEFDAAQNIFDEAQLLIKHTPIDDQIAYFYLALVKNQEELASTPHFAYLLAAHDSQLITDRTHFMILGALGSITFAFKDKNVDTTKAHELILEIMEGLIYNGFFTHITENDPQMAAQWCAALIDAGKDQLAKNIAETLLSQHKDPIISIYAATMAARQTAKSGNWKETIHYIMRANREMVARVKSAAGGQSSITIADTLRGVRELARYVWLAPVSAYDEVFPVLADLQSSLKLSADLASEYLPLSQDANLDSPAMWIKSVQRIIPESVQLLHFLDVGNHQIPILTLLGDSKIVVRRGDPIASDKVRSLSREISNVIEAWPAKSSRDPFDAIETYVQFRDEFLNMMSLLDLDNNISLLVVPSSAILGLPLHQILCNQPMAYVPAVSVPDWCASFI